MALFVHDILLKRHFKACIKKVIISAIANDESLKIVMIGVNDNALFGEYDNILKIGCAKGCRSHFISPCDKDSDDLLMLINVIFSTMLSDLFKISNPIEEDGLGVFECLVFPDLCHSLQPSKMACPLFYAQAFQRVKSYMCSSLANKIGKEGVQASCWKFMR
jgi:hypothetical protein